MQSFVIRQLVSTNICGVLRQSTNTHDFVRRLSVYRNGASTLRSSAPAGSSRRIDNNWSFSQLRVRYFTTTQRMWCDSRAGTESSTISGASDAKVVNAGATAAPSYSDSREDKTVCAPVNAESIKEGSKLKGSDKQSARAKPVKIELPADIRRIELRVGRIVQVSKHPDADSLFVEQVDLGEADGRHRTVVSGLVRFVKEEDLRGRLAVFMTNLRPAKLRGILSEAMILCASNSDRSQLEVLTVPTDSQPGDKVYATGYEDGQADKELQPKRRVWEDAVKPFLRTNADGVACYRDAPLRVSKRDGVICSNVKSAQIS